MQRLNGEIELGFVTAMNFPYFLVTLGNIVLFSVNTLLLFLQTKRESCEQFPSLL